MKIVKPTLHLNGSSRTALRDALLSANNRLRGAIEALHGCAPNARDYYPQGDSAFPGAAVEHRARLERLTAVRAELVELIEHVTE